MVSVIIPNYNHAAYLRQRIESVLNQTYQDFELIILDDCSTDNSRDIIESYRGNVKISHIEYNQVNSGSTFKQWDKGIKLAKREWIWIAESDDWCEKTFLETLMTGVTESENLAFCQSLCVNNSGAILQRGEVNKIEEIKHGIDYIKETLIHANFIINASMCLFRKSAYDYTDKLFKEFKFCGDWFFWIEILKRGNVFISGKTLNYFRNNSSGVTNSHLRSGLFYTEYFIILDKLCVSDSISNEETFGSVSSIYRNFLNDTNLDSDARKLIRKRFKTLLGKNEKKIRFKDNLKNFLRRNAKKMAKYLR